MSGRLLADARKSPSDYSKLCLTADDAAGKRGTRLRMWCGRAPRRAVKSFVVELSEQIFDNLFLIMLRYDYKKDFPSRIQDYAKSGNG